MAWKPRGSLGSIHTEIFVDNCINRHLRQLTLRPSNRRSMECRGVNDCSVPKRRFYSQCRTRLGSVQSAIVPDHSHHRRTSHRRHRRIHSQLATLSVANCRNCSSVGRVEMAGASVRPNSAAHPEPLEQRTLSRSSSRRPGGRER